MGWSIRRGQSMASLPSRLQDELEGDGLVHVTETHAVTKGEVEAVGWVTNLRPAVPAGLEDENAALRLRLKKLEARTGDGEEAEREEPEERRSEKEEEEKEEPRQVRRKTEVKRAEEKRPQRVQHPRKTEEEGGSTRSAGSKSWRGEAGVPLFRGPSPRDAAAQVHPTIQKLV